MKQYYFYILASKKDGTLYVGVTSNLRQRVYQHREGLIDGFTKKYGVKRLVYYETYDDVYLAIQREKNVKEWNRAWKVALIVEDNPQWDDLYEGLGF